MSNLDNLKKRIEEKLSAVEATKRAKHQEHNQYLMQSRERQLRFKDAADPIMSNVITPRMEQLAGYFDNAEFVEKQGHSRLQKRLQFAHTKRFPATTNLELSISHDVGMEHLIVSYNVEIIPVLIQFERNQTLTVPVAEVDKEQLTAWVDERICQFVDTYLHLEQAEPYQENQLATDPVCGMRVVKAFATEHFEHKGETYYFCVAGCRNKFADAPETYLSSASD